MCWQLGIHWHAGNVDNEFAYQAWKKNQGCFQTSAMGRIFDAAAALVLGIQQCSFDGQAPMQLEQVSAPLDDTALELPMEKTLDDIYQVDWSPLLPVLMNRQLGKVPG